jgi:hypothetical protein
MKKISSFLVVFFITVVVSAQKETFDLATYTVPKAWKKQPAGTAIQFTKHDEAKGIYCVISLFKGVEATADSKENFDMAWTSMVKEMVTITTAPIMEASEMNNGWEVLSGYAPFEKDGNKGVVILVNSSGFGRMVNLIILTNTDVYEKDMTAFITSMSLKKPTSTLATSKTETAITPTQKPVSQPAVSNGFAFTTTNFDDGWTSIAQEDWVQVTKGNTKVLIHYPNKSADAYNSVVLDGLKNAWNVLVAPRYNSASNFEFKPITGWQSIEFAEADVIEKISGNAVHVVLFKMNYSGGNGRYLEFITADKNAFEQEFGAYHQETYGWEKTEKMATYNKFAVAVTDLKGKWTNNFTGTQLYVNAYTGNSAGMDTHSSAQKYEFTGSTYKWEISAANGFVGNIKFQSAKSAGKFSLPNNWQVYFSELEGKPRTYGVYFSCIKGGRILWLDDTAFMKAE